MENNAPKSLGDLFKVNQARSVLDLVEQLIGSRFYTLENITAKGYRKFVLGPRPPKKALAVIDANRVERDILKKPERAPKPPHLVTRWDAQKHAWRTVDLNSIRAITFRDPASKQRVQVRFEQ